MKKFFIILSMSILAAFSSNAQTYIYETDAVNDASFSAFYENLQWNDPKPRSLKIRISYKTNQILINDNDSLLYTLEESLSNQLFPSESNTAFDYDARDQDEVKCIVYFVTQEDNSKWIVIQYPNKALSFRLLC